MKSVKGAQATRRQFLVAASATGMVSLSACSLMAQPALPALWMQATDESKLATDPMRPQFHLLPARNWMNDPNGPIYFDGHYHMFFQYNPHAAVWGDMSWGHAISPDMMHWKHLPLALTPTPGSADAYGCFSGSALAVGTRVYAVYTGTRESTPALATIRDGENRIQESQCLAWSDGANLQQWTKLAQPIVPLPPPQMQVTGFRDPSAWKQGDWYYMTVGSGEQGIGGCVLLYRSKQMEGGWEYLHKLTSGEWNGRKTPNPCGDGEMWECPEFFALDGGHVLIYSTLDKVFWQSGQLDEATMRFTAKHTGELDLGAFYAPKTQLDAEGRRILWGWIPEKRPEKEYSAAGWAGMMSLPRVLHLDADGLLRIDMLPALRKLRGEKVAESRTRDGAKLTLAKANGELLCRAASNQPLQVVLRFSGSTKETDETDELMRIAFAADGASVVVDGKTLALQPGDVPGVHCYVDGSVAGAILSGRVGYTKRFYYDQPVAPDIAVEVVGLHAEVSAWQITPISPDRLTS